MWEERFATPDYIFGTAPARFMSDHADWFKPGETGLSVADGEGRNSVFMAECGMDVTALEFAPSAISKARALAKSRGVEVNFRHCDVLSDPLVEGDQNFDIVTGIFIQFTGPTDRRRLFSKMRAATKPGGILMLHGYTPEQVTLGTGGPPFVENMYTAAILRDLFDGWDVLEVSEYTKDAQSGKGLAAYIDFIARKLD